jgi:nitrogen fixation NifU-like protein
MDYLNDPMVLRQIIMEHYQSPSNKGFADGEGYQKVRKDSDTCIADIEVEVKLENNKIVDINFDGVACTIATSSTDIAASHLEGKSVDEANAILEEYYKMINQEDYDAEVLGELVAFKNVGKQANRIKCGTIGLDAIKELINK